MCSKYWLTYNYICQKYLLLDAHLYPVYIPFISHIYIHNISHLYLKLLNLAEAMAPSPIAALMPRRTFPALRPGCSGKEICGKGFLYNGTDSQILGLGVSMSWSLGFKRKQISKQPPFYFLPQSIHGSGTVVIRCDKSLNPNFNAWQHATHTVLAIMKRFEVIWSK